MTDPIADMLTRIRNAFTVKKKEVVIPHSKLKEKIAALMLQEGYIAGFRVEKRSKVVKDIVIQLKYKDGTSAIARLRRISKPGRRVYASREEIPVVLQGLGVAIISTSQGLMTGQEARKKGVGGEVLCEIY